MKLVLVAWGLSGLLLAQEAPVSVPCMTCAGTGVATLACEACDGTGRGPCLECATPLVDEAMRWWLPLWRRTDPEQAAKLEASLHRLREQRKELSELSGIASFAPVPGRIPCAANCMGGKPLLNPRHPCQECKGKGSLTCPICSGKGDGACRQCSGRKSVPGACPECVGSGTGRALDARTQATLAVCPWCLGVEIRDCQADHETQASACVTCAGAGSRLCRACGGTSKAPCKKCLATGDLSFYRGPKDSDRCSDCSGKGVFPCVACRKGRAACQACGGDGRSSFCRACRGGMKAPCPGCWQGSGEAWRVTGERLLEGGEVALGVAHLEEALRREVASAKDGLAGFEGTPDERRALENRLSARAKSLRWKLEQARK